MMLKDNPEITLPQFSGGSYSGFDHIFLPHEKLILSEVKLSNSGNLELIAKPDDGAQEQWTGQLKFIKDDENKKEFLKDWLKERIGKTIYLIYRSEFSFERHV
jgi:hypothetical protein